MSEFHQSGCDGIDALTNQTKEEHVGLLVGEIEPELLFHLAQHHCGAGMDGQVW